MNDNSGRKAFRPTPLDENRVLHVVTPWAFARLMEQEANWLLQRTFPVWSHEGDPLTRAIWTRMCSELLLETGELLALVWKTLNSEGDVRLFSRYMPDGLRVVVGLSGGKDDRQVQVHLVELVFAELRRERSLGEGKQKEPFTFIDVMRQEYDQASDVEREDTTRRGVAAVALTIARSWLPTIRAALDDENTWRLPMPPSRKG
ncbi:hypothetical protein E7T06_08850 [Deinococcus sp. Arct2-2]|uniref:hypothetical protein n=1 Tax=Deinococcus sp. Arct2-2 TaxID=2568653 RepID=UPI0010A38227|nr:hypothetical protein [Deinococcus sp. Arct2-2]THF70148.1 hypothetical protein E7T06_08850 [Deinococcus sp. Arct2-2]